MQNIETLLREYKALSEQISAMEAAKKETRDAIMAALRSKGDNVSVLEAGGLRASIHYRDYLGFADKDEGGVPVPEPVLLQRLTGLRRFMAEHAPLQDVPASERIQKAWDALCASLPEGSEPALPEFLRKSVTPVLRVSGG